MNETRANLSVAWAEHEGTPQSWWGAVDTVADLNRLDAVLQRQHRIDQAIEWEQSAQAQGC